jgi:hypothetical protein
METLKRSGKDVTHSQEPQKNIYPEIPVPTFHSQQNEPIVYPQPVVYNNMPRPQRMHYPSFQRFGPPNMHSFPQRHGFMPVRPPMMQPQPVPVPLLNNSIPHISPQFNPHPHPPYMSNEFHMDYVPTPTIRLSPRTAE